MPESAMRRMLIPVAAILTLAAATAIAYLLLRDDSSGPFRPVDTVNSFGTWAEDGTTVSFVVQLRGTEPVTITLAGVSLVNPGPGLELVESGVLLDGYPGTYMSAKEFPLGRLAPIAGTTWTNSPGNPEADLFLNLGIRVGLDQSPQSIHGVWLNYHAGLLGYRAFLPWLLTICEPPITGTCRAIGPDELSHPPL